MKVEELCCVYTTPMSEEDASRLALQLKALADPVRIRLVSMVASAESGEICACDIPEALGRSQPTISHHLGQLVSAGILSREQRGKWAWFSLTEQIEEIRSALTPCCQ